MSNDDETTIRHLTALNRERTPAPVKPPSHRAQDSFVPSPRFMVNTLPRAFTHLYRLVLILSFVAWLSGPTKTLGRANKWV